MTSAWKRAFAAALVTAWGAACSNPDGSHGLSDGERVDAGGGDAERDPAGEDDAGQTDASTDETPPLPDASGAAPGDSDATPGGSPSLALLAAERAEDGGLIALGERLATFAKTPGRQSLLRLDTEGHATVLYEPSAEASLLDFARLASGVIATVAREEGRYALHCVSPEEGLIATTFLEDAAAAEDPACGEVDIPDDLRPAEESLDSARISARDSSVWIALRTASRSVILYRFAMGPACEAVRQWRAVVAPHHVWGFEVGNYGFSYDVFEQIGHSARVFLDVDRDGNAYVALPGTPKAISCQEMAFGEELPLEADPPTLREQDVLLTKFRPSGERVYGTSLATPDAEEIYGLRASEDEVLVVGRVNHGYLTYDAFVLGARADTGALTFAENIDVSNGDILYDIARLADGTLIAVGATDWRQGAMAASVGEHSEKLVLHLEPDGRVRTRLGVRSGPRHNQLRVVIAAGAKEAIVAGFDDAPGTHSADQDPAKLRSTPFLQRVSL